MRQRVIICLPFCARLEILDTGVVSQKRFYNYMSLSEKGNHPYILSIREQAS